MKAGALVCAFKTSAAGPLSLFCGDYALGEAPIVPKAGDFAAQFSLAGLPPLHGPFEFRFMLADTGAELKPSFTVHDAEALLAASGPGPIWCSLAAVDGRTISFHIVPEHLPLFARRIELMVDGVTLGAATSVPPKPAEAGQIAANAEHLLTFPLSGMLRDGALIELVDTGTGTLVHSQALTWAAIASALMGAQKILDERQTRMAAELARLRAKLGAVGDISRDVLMLERLDLYHGLVMDRLDREFAAVRQELGLADPVHAPLPEPAAPHVLLPADLEGVGLYHVEFDGDRQWRWFGPDTTLILRDVDHATRLLRIQYGLPDNWTDIGPLQCQINGRHAQIVSSPADHAHCLELCLTPNMHRPDRCLIIHLRFDQSYSPPNDERVLSMSCSTVELIAA